MEEVEQLPYRVEGFLRILVKNGICLDVKEYLYVQLKFTNQGLAAVEALHVQTLIAHQFHCMRGNLLAAGIASRRLADYIREA